MAVRPSLEELDRLLQSDDATPAHIHRDGSVSCGTRSTIFFDQAGPFVQYVGGMLVVEDLNPQVMTKWRMSRWEMARMGWRCLVAAVRR